jgi:UDP-N-acetyl-D-mannosaminuronate dehydrogenase
LGLGFRPEVKVDTFSSAYALNDELLAHNAIISLADPFYTDDEILSAGFRPARVGEDPVDAVILNTAHAAFANPDFEMWRRSGVAAVVDGRAFWDPAAAERAGLLYLGIGQAARGGSTVSGIALRR